MDIDFIEAAPRSSEVNLAGRPKSPVRMGYEAEVKFLLQQNGGLEEIRQKLGLSRRKICQLLLVDPSAWTRWTAPKGKAPPHIHRALDWYLSIMEKDPEYRRLSQRFAGWLAHEKDHEGRLSQLEARITTAKLQNLVKAQSVDLNWRPWVSLALAFLSGALLMHFLK